MGNERTDVGRSAQDVAAQGAAACPEMSDTKQRILKAIRRRRKLKEPMRRQMISGAFQVMASGMLFMTAMARAATKRCGQWVQRRYGTNRVDIMEVFGGHSEISMEASRQGWLATQP